MNRCTERLYNGLIKENPTFVLMLGMCPTLAVTTSAINGIGMGLSTTVVLVLSNMLISMLRKIIPDSVRMPAFIVVVASFVTIVQFLLEGFVPSLYDSLGLYIPLIVVNCIILGRAESYASKNPVLPSVFDGIGMGMDNDIDGGIPFWPEYVMADGGRAQVVNADILLALREKGYLKQAPDVLNIGDEANPVVILYTFKR